MKIKTKKGVSTYLAWVLIMAFVVTLSTLMFSFMTTQVKTHTEEIEQRTDLSKCDMTGFSITSFCQDESSLIFNITNTKNNEISGLKIQLFDLYDISSQNKINISIKPSDSEKILVLKHGTLLQAEIIPKMDNEEREYYCDSSKIILTPIEFC